MRERYRSCTLCPRACGADRTAATRGVCRMGATMTVARAALHRWEEPCLADRGGAGAVFFVGCPLRCVYCQNRGIAAGEGGLEVTPERLCEIFFELYEQGAQNIDLVTPTHFAPGIAEAIRLARARGFSLPFVYNCGGYERVETLRCLDGLIDIYLPDFKYRDAALAARYSGAPDYPEVAEAALAEMVRQRGDCRLDAAGRMTSGVLVRHLMLPGAYRNSHDVLKYLATTYGERIYLSLMNQYTPMPGIEASYPELAASVSDHDYRRLVAYAVRLGVTQAYVQEGGTVSESFIPAFDGEGVAKKKKADVE